MNKVVGFEKSRRCYNQRYLNIDSNEKSVQYSNYGIVLIQIIARKILRDVLIHSVILKINHYNVDFEKNLRKHE